MRKFPCGCCGGSGLVHEGTPRERVCPFCIKGFTYIDDGKSHNKDDGKTQKDN